MLRRRLASRRGQGEPPTKHPTREEMIMAQRNPDMFGTVEAWIDEAPDADRRASRARVVAARRGKSGAVEVPPYVVQAPEYVTRWGAVEPPVGTVIRWVPDANYPKTYAVVQRVSVGWMGPLPTGSSWSDVVDLIKNAPADVASGWTSIPTVPEPEEGDEAVASWASQFLPSASPQVSTNIDSPENNG